MHVITLFTSVHLQEVMPFTIFTISLIMANNLLSCGSIVKRSQFCWSCYKHACISMWLDTADSFYMSVWRTKLTSMRPCCIRSRIAMARSFLTHWVRAGLLCSWPWKKFHKSLTFQWHYDKNQFNTNILHYITHVTV